MGIFESMFSGGHSSQEGHHESEHSAEPDFVHKDFKAIDGIWRVNSLYEKQRQSGELPGLTFDFVVSEDHLGDLLEDFPAPAQIRRIGPDEYKGIIYVNKDNAPNIDEWLLQNKAQITSAPEGYEAAA